MGAAAHWWLGCNCNGYLSASKKKDQKEQRNWRWFAVFPLNEQGLIQIDGVLQGRRVAR